MEWLLLFQELYEEAIKDSTSALDLNPLYLKALMRRAELYEKNEKLEDALGDYQKILEMDPSQYAARAACLVSFEINFSTDQYLKHLVLCTSLWMDMILHQYTENFGHEG